MVDTGVTIATDLHIKPFLLEVSYQWETTGDGIRFAFSKNVTSSSMKMFESRGIQVDCNALLFIYIIIVWSNYSFT